MLNAQPQLKTLAQLTADNSGWTVLKEEISTAKNQVSILPVTTHRAQIALTDAQVTTHSTLGAVIYFTGGLLIDHGWLRILGSGCTQLNRSVMEWNKGKTYNQVGEKSGYLLVADDAAGGFYAINAGALGKDFGNVYYLAPDTLDWESLERGYTDWIDFCLNGDIDGFYKNLRWKNWLTDVQKLSGDQVYNFYPYLWTKEGQDINAVSKKPVPVNEQYALNMDFRKQLTTK